MRQYLFKFSDLGLIGQTKKDQWNFHMQTVAQKKDCAVHEYSDLMGKKRLYIEERNGD